MTETVAKMQEAKAETPEKESKKESSEKEYTAETSGKELKTVTPAKPQESKMKPEEARQYAIISLSVVCLATLILHAVLVDSDSEPEAPPGAEPSSRDVLRFLIGMLMVFVWIAGASGWVVSCGMMSVASRNRALIYGFAAANVAMAYLMIMTPPVAGRVYMACTLWPLYGGLAVGMSI